MSMTPSPITPSTPRVAFISGHTDLSETHFAEHYIPQIERALTAGHRFIIGDAKGVDSMALAYLLSLKILLLYPNIAARISIHASRPYNVPKLQRLAANLNVIAPADPNQSEAKTVVVVKKGGQDKARWQHVQRDAGITAASDYDILYVRSEEESRELYGQRWRPRISATELNRQRRMALQK